MRQGCFYRWGQIRHYRKIGRLNKRQINVSATIQIGCTTLSARASWAIHNSHHILTSRCRTPCGCINEIGHQRRYGWIYIEGYQKKQWGASRYRKKCQRWCRIEAGPFTARTLPWFLNLFLWHQLLQFAVTQLLLLLFKQQLRATAPHVQRALTVVNVEWW